MRNLYLIIIAQVYSYNNTDIPKSSDVFFVSRIIYNKTDKSNVLEAQY